MSHSRKSAQGGTSRLIRQRVCHDPTAAPPRADETRYARTLAYFQDRAGKREGTLRTLADLLRDHPSHGDATLLLADVLERDRKRSQAKAALRRAVEARGLTNADRSRIAACLASSARVPTSR